MRNFLIMTALRPEMYTGKNICWSEMILVDCFFGVKPVTDPRKR